MKHFSSRIALVLVCLFALCQPRSYAQAPPMNVTLVGQLAFPQGCSDVWGYVDSLGNEWAIVGAQDGVSLVNLSNPSNPTLAFHFPGVNTTWRDIKTWGPYAYITNEGGDGLRIIDLRGLPANAVSKDTIINGMTTGHNLYIDNGLAYIVGGDIDNAGLSIFDVGTDPLNPSYLGGYDATYVHDVYVRDNVAYAAEMFDGELTLLDVTNPTNIQTLGSVTYPAAFTHNTWLSDNDSICFVTDELDFSYIRSFDISDPQNIVELDKIRASLSNGSAVPHNTHVLNDWLVTSYYADGLHIVDAHRPTNLVEVGHYDTNPQTGGGTFGLWGAYPFLPSGLILGTDMSEGLFVWDVDFKRAAYLEGTATDMSSNALSNVNITVAATPINELTTTLGEYATGIADSGSFTASAFKFGYQQVDTTLTLAPGVVSVWNPRLPAAPTIAFTVRVEDATTNQPIAGAEVLADASGNQFTYVTNASGEATDPAFVSSSYDIVAGKWGYVTNGVTTLVDSANATITIQLEPGYYDDYTFDFGWNVSGSAADGDWVRAEPTRTEIFGNTVQTDFDVQDDWGDQCFVTGDGAGLAEDFDLDGGRTLLTSPVMDLSGTNNPYLIFDWWFLNVTGFGQIGFRDSLGIEIDNGVTVQTAWFVKDIISPFWTRDTVKIANWVQPTANVTVTFFASDNLFDHVVEAAIDRFMIVDQQTTSVPEVAQTEMTVYPNPSNGDFTLRYDLGGLRDGVFEMYDLNGKMVLRRDLNADESEVSLDGQFTPGLYFGKLRSGDQILKTVKIVRL